MTDFFKALLHHLGRAVDANGRELFAQADSRAETVDDVRQLESLLNSYAIKIAALEARADAADKRIEAVAEHVEDVEAKVDQPDWRERR